MPYNTRRKSLSLPSLGIHVPVSKAAAAAIANRSSLSGASPSGTTPSSATADMLESPSRDEQHRNKKLKRVHSESFDGTMRSPPPPAAKKRDEASVKFVHTPPPSPSPPAQHAVADTNQTSLLKRKVDLDGINDEIVEAVITQLQDTDNRPHLVKELAAVLMQQLKVVQQSANPCAIISSRLSTYLKRSCWTALAPCPLAKELETVHPRRTYFYLSTCPHQPLPDHAQAAALSQLALARTIITPSLSSAASTSTSDIADSEARRRELSPSPEVDLSSPEFDEMDDDIMMPGTPVGSLSIHGFGLSHLRLDGSAPDSAASSRHPRAASPPLEKDEKEFTQTADGLQKRKMSGDLLSTSANLDQVANGSIDLDFGGRDESGLFGLGANDTKAALIGAATLSVGPALPVATFVTSPAIRPVVYTFNVGKRDGEAESWAKLDGMLEWDRSPENIELEELDGLLTDY